MICDEKTLTRFHSKYIPVTESGCWIWTDHLCRGDYAQFYINGALQMSHRVSYEIHIGPIPRNMEIDHICRVRCCVNPEHLRPLPHKDNVLCGSGLTAKHALKTHCINGHPFSGDNLQFKPNRNERVCRQCNKDRALAWRRSRI